MAPIGGCIVRLATIGSIVTIVARLSNGGRIIFGLEGAIRAEVPDTSLVPIVGNLTIAPMRGFAMVGRFVTPVLIGITRGIFPLGTIIAVNPILSVLRGRLA